MHIWNQRFIIERILNKVYDKNGREIDLKTWGREDYIDFLRYTLENSSIFSFMEQLWRKSELQLLFFSHRNNLIFPDINAVFLPDVPIIGKPEDLDSSEVVKDLLDILSGVSAESQADIDRFLLLIADKVEDIILEHQAKLIKMAAKIIDKLGIPLSKLHNMSIRRLKKILKGVRGQKAIQEEDFEDLIKSTQLDLLEPILLRLLARFPLRNIEETIAKILNHLKAILSKIPINLNEYREALRILRSSRVIYPFLATFVCPNKEHESIVLKMTGTAIPSARCPMCGNNLVSFTIYGIVPELHYFMLQPDGFLAYAVAWYIATKTKLRWCPTSIISEAEIDLLVEGFNGYGIIEVKMYENISDTDRINGQINGAIGQLIKHKKRVENKNIKVNHGIIITNHPASKIKEFESLRESILERWKNKLDFPVDVLSYEEIETIEEALQNT